MSEVSSIPTKPTLRDYIFPWVSLIAAYMLFYITQFVVVFALMSLKIDYDKYTGIHTVVSSSAAILVMSVFALLFRKVYSDNRSGITISKPELPTVIMVIVIGFGLLGFVNLYMLIAEKISQLMQGGALQEQLEEYSESVDRYSEIVQEEVPKFDKILYYLGVTILVPISEEIVFRGLMLGPFLKRYPMLVGLFSSAIIFGLAHGVSIHIGYALASGLIIGMVYCFTQNLVYNCIIHMTFNFFGSTLIMMFNDGFINLSEDVSDAVFFYIWITEFFMILPTIGFIVTLGAKYKAKNKQNAEEVKSVEEVTAE